MIDSYEDFVAFTNRTNNGTDGSGKFYKQTVDITIPSTETSWSSIGDSSYSSFKGHYNGNGKKITNSVKNSYKRPLFGYIDVRVGDYAIKNLSLDYTADPYDDTTSYYLTGALAECLTNGTIDNVKVNATVRYRRDYDDPVGGIVGTVSAGGSVKNCVFNGSVSLKDYSSSPLTLMAGGIAGLLEGGKIENCLVSADMVSADNSDSTDPAAYAGGIVGIVSGDAKVFNSAFKGKVYSTKYAGGIAGYVIKGTVESCYVLDSSNVDGASFAGGIAGALYSEGVISGDKIVMTSNVKATNTAVGGIVGELESGKVMYNWAYTILNTDTAQYHGPIVGRILPGAVAAGKYTVKYNKYLAGVAQTETYEGIEDTAHEAETLTDSEMNPVDTSTGTTTTTPETPEPTGTEQVTYESVTINIDEQGANIREKLGVSEDTEIKTDSYTTSDRSPDSVTDEEKEGKTLVSALPSITVNESAVYIFRVHVTNLSADENISLHMNGTTGILIDDNGNAITKLPASQYVNIAAYMEQGTTYNPVLLTAAASEGENTSENESETGTSETKNEDSGGGGGGCDSSALGLIGLAILIRKRH